MNCSLPGSSVSGVLQAGTVKWIAIFFSRVYFDSGIKPGSPELQMDSLLTEPPGNPWYTIIVENLIALVIISMVPIYSAYL